MLRSVLADVCTTWLLSNCYYYYYTINNRTISTNLCWNSLVCLVSDCSLCCSLHSSSEILSTTQNSEMPTSLILSTKLKTIYNNTPNVRCSMRKGPRTEKRLQMKVNFQGKCNGKPRTARTDSRKSIQPEINTNTVVCLETSMGLMTNPRKPGRWPTKPTLHLANMVKPRNKRKRSMDISN